MKHLLSLTGDISDVYFEGRMGSKGSVGSKGIY